MSTHFGKESLFWLLLINSPLLIPEDAAYLKTSNLPTSPSHGTLEKRGAEIKHSSPAVCTLSLWLFSPRGLSHFKQTRQRKPSLAFQPIDSFICVDPKTLFFSSYYGSLNLNFPRWLRLLHLALIHKNSPWLIIRHLLSNWDCLDAESACGGSERRHGLEPPHAT